MKVSLHRLTLLRELRYRSTVTAVAEALHYTTSAVSQQLSLLEREVGTELLERKGRRVVLTEAGNVMADHAETILGAVEQASNAMEAMREGMRTTLTAGMWASVATGLLPTGIAKLSESAPGIEVRSVELVPEDTAGAVRDGSLDLSFIIDYSNYPMPRTQQLSRRSIGVERINVAVPKGTVATGATDLAVLSSSPWILADRRSHFGRAARIAMRDAGFDPDVRHVVGEQSTSLALVAAGLGVTPVSDLGVPTVPDGVDIVPVHGEFSRTLSIAYRSRDADRESLRLFIDAMAEAALEVGLQPPPDASYPPET